MNRDKETLMLMGQKLAELCDGEVTDAEHILLTAHANGFPVTTADMQVMAIASARWALNGFPQVALSASYAAALCATDVPESVLEEVIGPWDGWLIEVPDGLLSFSLPGNKLDSIRRILITQQNNLVSGPLAWSWQAFGASGTALFRFGVHTKYLACANLKGYGDLADHELSLFPGEIDSRDDRASALVGRLICGVCLAMRSPENISRKPSGSTPTFKKRRPGAPPPMARTYLVGAPIRLDCRPALHAYLEGHRHAPPSVQHIVRGHWKMQAHGAGSALRKTIWVAPYWRGPEDAPVLVRSHVMEGGNDA